MSILEAYPPAGVIFTGIGVLLSVSIDIDIFSGIIVTSRYHRLLRVLAQVKVHSLIFSRA